MKKDCNILIIDDSATNILLLETVLNESGYNTKTALNIKEAFAILDKSIPSLIILDLLMPKINGYDFMEKIRNEQATKNIPVIIVSAVNEPEDIKKALSYGVVDFIKKPVDIQHLSDLVESVIG